MTLFKRRYYLPATPREVHDFFLDVRNMERVWPPELGMKVVERMDSVFRVRFRLLGQIWTASFRIIEEPEYRQRHETLDFPFGVLRHSIEIAPSEGGSIVSEYVELRSRIPFASRFLARVWDYREAMIKRSFGLDAQAIYRDPTRIGLLAGTAISMGAVAAAVALTLAPTQYDSLIGFLTRLASWLLLWFFTHDLAHLAVGALVGVKFSHYYLGLSNVVRLGILPRALRLAPLALGIRIDRERTRASPRGYAAMYAAGPLASMFTPLLVPAAMLLDQPTSTAGLLFLAASLANIAFTSYFSPKAGCFAKASKALRRARSGSRGAP